MGAREQLEVEDEDKREQRLGADPFRDAREW